MVTPNWIDGRARPVEDGARLPKISPIDGALLLKFPRSSASEVDAAVAAAKNAQPGWAKATPVRRGEVIRAAAELMRARAKDLAEVIHRETGKSAKDALGEVQAAVEMGFFVAGEGRRFYGKTTTSAAPNKNALTVRQPIGLAGLIVAANTPIANVAWKAFPALLCGNAAVLKSSEDAPATALEFVKILHQCGLPAGVLNLVHGLGPEAGAALVEHPDVRLISFTGSTAVGRRIQEKAGAMLKKVCLELGGKNPLVVCDDAELDRAVDAACASAFSNAGQRCAAASRVIVFKAIYEEFKKRFLKKVSRLKVGSSDGDDLGPVINGKQLENILAAVERAKKEGAKVLAGGRRLGGALASGFYIAPTVIEGAAPDAEVSQKELFGPVCALYRVRDFQDALRLANATSYGLTASIHTRSLDRAMAFLEGARSGVAVANGPTYGSEPHMPFGGPKDSGTGWREAGTEALDVYSDWKTLYVNFDPEAA